MNNESKRTSLMRYKRVSNILRSDRLLSQKLSKTMVAVCKHDQTHEDFPAEVVYVTQEIHKEGIDAYTMPKNEIIRTAHRLLIQNPGPIPIPAPETQPEPQPKAKAARSKPAAKAKAVKAAKPPKPKPKPEKKARRAPSPKAPATAEERPAAVEPSSTGGAPNEDRSPPPSTSKPPPEYVRPFIPYVVGVAILSLLQAILTLFEPFMSNGDGDAKDVCQKVNELIDEIHRRTVIPASAEKESKSAG